MHQRSKRIVALREAVEKIGVVTIVEAVKILRGLESSLPVNIKKCKFDQTVEIAVRLGVDPKQSDQLVRGSIVLPHGIGKTKRVLVFAQGQNVDVAKNAGADYVGGKDLSDQIKAGWLDFDVAIASPDMMGVVGPLGKVLGPRGLMPSPRAGTVTSDLVTAIKEYKAGKVEFRVDAAGIVHCVVGKISFEENQLTENIQALIKYLHQIKPAASKGVYVRTAYVTATMMPSIAVSA
ncbi:MAG: 50S ribosomal protein L1 [Planctomycetia bacterium]|nr:50S ribosomal protein L1 [Planctomycetia bacterium]